MGEKGWNGGGSWFPCVWPSIERFHASETIKRSASGQREEAKRDVICHVTVNAVTSRAHHRALMS